MTCQDFWSRSFKVAVDEFEADSAAQAHLRECEACRTRVAREKELGAGLRRLMDTYQGVNAPGRVEARLVKAFRAQYGAPVRQQGRSWKLPLSWAAAAAVVGLAILSITMVRQGLPSYGNTAANKAPSADLSAANAVDPGLLAAGFIPLPNGEGIGPNDSFNLVRVELPRSAMMTVGIAVSADRAAEPVEADVLLGSDGLARAVRFSD